MNGYLTSAQVEQLLKPINSRRVSTDGKGFSHVEAYDIRAHLNRIFGFGRWSADVSQLELVFEDSTQRRKKNKQGEEYGDPYIAWTVCYRAVMRVTVHAPDGQFLAAYEDGATGEATHQPSRGDAHDLAMKTALSQALKRAAVNLGDQFGLSLYNKGSLNALVGKTLTSGAVFGEPTGAPGVESAAVDEHITGPLAAEDATPDEPRSTTVAAVPDVEPASDLLLAAEAIRDTLQAVLAASGAATQAETVKTIGDLMKQAQRDKCLAVKVETRDGLVPLKILLENGLRQVRTNAA